MSASIPEQRYPIQSSGRAKYDVGNVTQGFQTLDLNDVVGVRASQTATPVASTGSVMLDHSKQDTYLR